MLEHPNIIRPSADGTVETDVCVIGSGAGGAAFAAEAAEAGMKVVLLEKGGHFDRKDFNQREADMMTLLYEDGGARTTKDGGITVLHAACVGGTTTVNNAICFDPPTRLLESWRDEHGIVGMGPKELAPAIAKVNFILNVQPIADLELNKNARLLRDGSRRLGLSGSPFRHNRTACLQSGFCMLGCSYDRKQTSLVTYVPRAMHFGAKLYPFTEVERLEADGARIAVAHATVKGADGKTHRLRIKASRFVVAGGAISTPLLLLRSGLNPNGQVGKHLSLHPLAPAFALFDDDVRAYKGIPQGYYIDAFEPDFLIESIFTHPGLVAATVPGFGREHAQLMVKLNKMAAAYAQIKDVARGEVRVGREGYPEIHYPFHPADGRMIKEGWKAIARIFLAAGAREAYVPHIDLARPFTRESQLSAIDRLDISPSKQTLMSAHQMGTCRMGKDPQTSVLNSDCRSHHYDNLYIADSSVFPTPSGVNPQITIMAIATHAAQKMIKASR